MFRIRERIAFLDRVVFAKTQKRIPSKVYMLFEKAIVTIGIVVSIDQDGFWVGQRGSPIFLDFRWQFLGSPTGTFEWNRSIPEKRQN